MKNNTISTKLLVLLFFLPSMMFAEDSPFQAFSDTLMNQTSSYLIPVLIIVVLISGAITYAQTKDWKVSLLVAGLSGAVIGAAPSLMKMFSSFEFATS